MLPIDKTYLKTNLINWKTAILDPAYIIQKGTLPTASAQNLGKVFQYIGSDSTNYTIGGFYQCQVISGTDPVEYTWVEITSKTSIDNTTIKENSSKQLYVPKATNSALGVVQAGDGIDVDSNGIISVVARLEEIDELPTATAALEGKIYLLTAAQTGYDRGGIYMCEESTETAGTYEWKLISMSPLEAGKGITIEDDVISADTNLFSGTKEEYEALSADEKKKYDYLASPETVGGDFDVYSTSETKTNKVWIDGKPIYRKVITDTAPSTADTEKGFAIGASVSAFVSVSGFLAFATNGVSYPFGQKLNDNEWSIVWCRTNNHSTAPNQVVMRVGASLVTCPVHIIVEYTKA